MIDIHCHMLFGVDDGPRTVEASAEMLKVARANRITEIILTPHYRHGMFSFPHDRIEASYAVLEEEAKRFSIRLYPGCEYHADSAMVENLRSGRCMTLANSDYVLTEFSADSTLMDIRSTLNELRSAGFKPVIAHAERYEVIRREPEVLADFRGGGVLVQLNAGNVLGEEGRQVKAACAKILKAGNADIIASDAHNTTSRRCRLRECRVKIARKYGKAVAKQLFHNNPERILNNE